MASTRRFTLAGKEIRELLFESNKGSTIFDDELPSATDLSSPKSSGEPWRKGHNDPAWLELDTKNKGLGSHLPQAADTPKSTVGMRKSGRCAAH